MIEFRTLGALELSGPDSRAYRGVLTQPKRVALLAYLAVATPHRFHRRDSLLALFWPELDQEHARSVLRQHLHGLRQVLGADVLEGRGDEEVGVAEAALWCDARAFDRAVAAGDLSGALDLYRGDLLEGFFISAAPEFDQWLDAERTRLREAAARSARTLIERCEASGDLAAAMDLARRAVRLAPHDEELIRRLLRLLDRLGERAAAIEAYDVFARRLNEELEAEPAAETQQLIAAVRARKPRAAAAEPPTTEAPPAATREALPSPDRPAPPEQPGRRRRLLTTGTLIAAVVALSMAGALALRHAAGVKLNPHRVVVAAFDNQTGDTTLDRLGAMAADWISRGLEETGLVEVAAPGLVRLEAQGRGLRALAEVAGAGTLVSGTFYRQGDSVRFEAQVSDVQAKRLLRSVAPVATAERDPGRAVGVLRQRVVGALATVVDPRLNDWASLASQPPSYETYQEFVAGLEAYFQLDAREALRHFYRAAALDSTFVLPLVWAATAHGFLDECDRGDSLARSLSSRIRLARLDRFLLEHRFLSCHDDYNTAYRLARQLAEAYPSSEFLALNVARDALYLNRPAEAREILERLHPDRGPLRPFTPYYYFLVMALHQLGKHDRELDAARRARRQFPDNIVGLRDQVFPLAALGRVAELNALLDELPRFPPHPVKTPGEVIREAALELRAHGYGDASRLVFRRALAWFDARPRAELATEASRFERLQTLYAAERWDTARALAERLALEHPDSVSYVGLLGALAAQRGDRHAAARADSVLTAQWRPGLRGQSTYWRACIAARLGDRERAMRLLLQSRAEGTGQVWNALAHARQRSFYMAFHVDPSLETLRDDRRFQDWLRPRG